MNTPTAPTPPTASEKSALKGRAHALSPVVHIGQNGLTESVLREIDLSLNAHELIKIRVFAEDRAVRVELLAAICAQTASFPVQHIGKLLVIYRKRPEPEMSAEEKLAADAEKVKAPRRSKADYSPDSGGKRIPAKIAKPVTVDRKTVVTGEQAIRKLAKNKAMRKPGAKRPTGALRKTGR